MSVVKVLITVLMLLTLAASGSHSAGGRGRDRNSNNRRHRHRHNPYAVPPVTQYIIEDYDEVEVSSYCRESVAHHENYVREMTQAPNSSSKVLLNCLFFSTK